MLAVAVWWVVPSGRVSADPEARWDLSTIPLLLRRPELWLQSLIVVCAYVGYKGTDDLSLLASDVLGYNDVDAAWVGTLAFYIRPVAAAGSHRLERGERADEAHVPTNPAERRR